MSENGHGFRRKGEKLCYLPKPPKDPRVRRYTLGCPWSRAYEDYAGPFMGKMFLLVIDAHSKWMNINCVNSATSSVTIERMRTTFASRGLPEIVESDKRSNFVSSEFKSFLQKNGIRHITSAPYHPGKILWWNERYRLLSKGCKSKAMIPSRPR